jgi:glutamine amidotransferase
MHASEPTKVECTLVHAQNALMSQSRKDLSGHSHIHGWGVAAYEDHLPHVERQAWAAYHGEHFKRAAARIYATTVLAHVRAATVGEPELDNTHPFWHGRWAFVHNGTLPAFADVAPRLLEELTDEHRAAIRGQTDSEHVFRLLMSRIDKNPDRPVLDLVREAARDILAWCQEAAPGQPVGLNIMLTDGERIFGARYGRTLHYIERDGVHDCEICGFPHVRHDPSAAYRATVLASEPITHEDWKEIPERSLYEVDPEGRLHVEPLE